MTSKVDSPWTGTNDEWWDWYLGLAAEEDGERGPLLEVAQPPMAPHLEPDALAAELDRRYLVTPEQITAFRTQGFVKLREVLSPGALGALRERLLAAVAEQRGAQAMEGFVSIENLWLDFDELKAFSLSHRLGRIAADLLGAGDVRLYHDNLLSKGPGLGRTPWHHDAHHFPLATRDVVTLWMPLQPTPRPMGPLAFAEGIDSHRLVEDLPFETDGDGYDAAVSRSFRDHGISVDDGPYELGDATFHHTLSFHTAGANLTTAPRVVFSNIYYADGARIVDRPTMISGDWQQFVPGVAPGGIAATERNPICS